VLSAGTHGTKLNIDGRSVLVHAGDVHPASSAVVKGREELFAPEMPAEQDTATKGRARK
jgi:hypothetical protein